MPPQVALHAQDNPSEEDEDGSGEEEEEAVKVVAVAEMSEEWGARFDKLEARLERRVPPPLLPLPPLPPSRVLSHAPSSPPPPLLPLPRMRSPFPPRMHSSGRAISLRLLSRGFAQIASAGGKTELHPETRGPCSPLSRPNRILLLLTAHA